MFGGTKFSRRYLIQLIGAAGIGSFAGCSEQGGRSSPTRTITPTYTPTRSPTRTSTDAPTETPTETETGTPTETETDTPTETPRENPDYIFVGPDGDDGNAGSRDSPLRTVQEGLARAHPGETVYVEPGEYTNPIRTVRPGKPKNPITLTGPPEARLEAGRADGGDMASIRHSYVHITGLTFDGLINPDKPDQASSYQLDPIITAEPEHSTEEYLQNIRISPHGIGNGAGALINPARIKDSEIGSFRVIGPAGLEWQLTDKEGHLGEIVYLGTDPTNLEEDSGPGNDMTRNIRIHHIDNSEGYAHSRLVQTKPGVHDITIEYCTDGGGTEIWREGTSSSVFFECHQATLRWNILKNGDGTGVTIGSPWANQEDATEAEQKSGSMNSVYGNRILGFEEEALRFPHSQGQEDQKYICGNEYDGKTDGDPDKSCPSSVPKGDGIGHLGGDSPWTGDGG